MQSQSALKESIKDCDCPYKTHSLSGSAVEGLMKQPVSPVQKGLIRIVPTPTQLTINLYVMIDS